MDKAGYRDRDHLWSGCFLGRFGRPHRTGRRRDAYGYDTGGRGSPGGILPGAPGDAGGDGGDRRIREAGACPAVEPRHPGRHRQSSLGAPVRPIDGLPGEDRSHRCRRHRLVCRYQAHRRPGAGEPSPGAPESPGNAAAPAHRAAHHAEQPAPPGRGSRRQRFVLGADGADRPPDPRSKPRSPRSSAAIRCGRSSTNASARSRASPIARWPASWRRCRRSAPCPTRPPAS